MPAIEVGISAPANFSIAETQMRPSSQEADPVSLSAEQQILAEFNLSHIPGEFVPAPEDRSFSQQEYDTSLHEGGHAILAQGETGSWAAVNYVSVKPSGDYLGVTTFSFAIPAEQFKIIAAGGAVDPPSKSASGFGSDLMQVRAANQITGGSFFDSVTGAIDKAKAYLSSIPEKVRERFAEMLAHLKVVSGGVLGELYARAQLEAALEEKGMLHLLGTALQEKGIKFALDQNTIALDPQRQNRIEYFSYPDGSGYYYKMYTYEGGEEKMVVICGECGVENGTHAQECPANPAGSRKNPGWMVEFQPFEATPAPSFSGSTLIDGTEWHALSDPKRRDAPDGASRSRGRVEGLIYDGETSR